MWERESRTNKYFLIYEAVTTFHTPRDSFDWGFYEMTPQQQKEILNLVLKEFVLYKDGKIELRFKLPVNEKQVAESILTLSHNKGV